MSNTAKVRVGWSERASANYQSKGSNFEIELVSTETKLVDGAQVARAQRLCKAMVAAQLGRKIGMRRADIDALSIEFLGSKWEQSGGAALDDEIL